MENSAAGADRPLESRSNASCLAIFVALTSVAVLGFFALSFVIVGGRWLKTRQGVDLNESKSTAVTSPWNTSGNPTWATPRSNPNERPGQEERAGNMAVVVVPPGSGPGKMRNLPGFENPGVMAYVPNGTPVEVLGERYVPYQGMTMTWYRVRANIGGKNYEGWMHSDLVKR